MSPKLPDYLAPNLRVVICGTAAGKTSASFGHYYAGQGNLFWTYLYRARITNEPLFPSTDHRVLEFGVGLTDFAKKIAASSDRGLRGHYDVDAFVLKIERYRPNWVAFHGKEAAKAVRPAPRRATWRAGRSRVPSPCFAPPTGLAVQPRSLSSSTTISIAARRLISVGSARDKRRAN